MQNMVPCKKMLRQAVAWWKRAVLSVVFGLWSDSLKYVHQSVCPKLCTVSASVVASIRQLKAADASVGYNVHIFGHCRIYIKKLIKYDRSAHACKLSDEATHAAARGDITKFTNFPSVCSPSLPNL